MTEALEPVTLYTHRVDGVYQIRIDGGKVVACAADYLEALSRALEQMHLGEAEIVEYNSGLVEGIFRADGTWL